MIKFMENEQKKSDSYLKYFWIVFYTSITLSCLVSIPILLDSYARFDPCFSHECFNYFFSKIMFLPLSILASSLPICAIFLALHKSHQTKLQILITEQQNNTSNLFTHKKEFNSLCNDIESNFPVIIDWQLAYSKIFPNNTSNELTVDFTSKSTDFFELDDNILELLNKLADNNYQPTIEDAVSAIHMIGGLYQKSGIAIEHNIKPSYLKQVCGTSGITHYLHVHLINGSEFETWQVYQKIMNQFAFFANVKFNFDPSFYQVGRLNHILRMNDRLTDNAPG